MFTIGVMEQLSGQPLWRRSRGRPSRSERMERLISQAGGVAALALRCGLCRQTINCWRRRGYVSDNGRARVAEALGIDVSEVPRLAKPLQPLIDAAGGRRALAAICGVHASNVSSWRTGGVPLKHYPVLRARGLVS